MKSTTNLSNEDSSSISCSASGQARYKKALKQISKLVSINMSLKKQIEQWKQKYSSMEYAYQELMTKYNGMSSKISHKTAEFGINQQTLRRNDFQNGQFRSNQNAVLEAKEAVSGQNSNQMSEYARQEQKIQELQRQVEEFEDKNRQKQDMIHQLHIALEKKHSQMIQLEGRCGDLHQELNNLKNAPPKVVVKQVVKQVVKEVVKQNSSISSNTTAINLELTKQKRKVEQLQDKLQKQQNWSKQVQSQYQQMRRSMMMPQTTSIQLNKLNSMTQLPPFHKSSKNIDTSKSKSKSKKSFQKSDNQIEAIKAQYAEKRSKYKTQISKLKQEVAQLNQRIISMNLFIEKQQIYIENFSSHSTFGQV